MGLRADSVRRLSVRAEPLTRWGRAESARNPIAVHVKFGDDCANAQAGLSQWTAALTGFTSFGVFHLHNTFSFKYAFFTDPRSLPNFRPKVMCSDVTKSAVPKNRQIKKNHRAMSNYCMRLGMRSFTSITSFVFELWRICGTGLNAPPPPPVKRGLTKSACLIFWKQKYRFKYQKGGWYLKFSSSEALLNHYCLVTWYGSRKSFTHCNYFLFTLGHSWAKTVSAAMTKPGRETNWFTLQSHPRRIKNNILALKSWLCEHFRSDVVSRWAKLPALYRGKRKKPATVVRRLGARPPPRRSFNIQNAIFDSVQAPVHNWTPTPGRSPVSAADEGVHAQLFCLEMRPMCDIIGQ